MVKRNREEQQRCKDKRAAKKKKPTTIQKSLENIYQRKQDTNIKGSFRKEYYIT